MKKTLRIRTHYKATFLDSDGVPRLKIICARGLGQAHNLLRRLGNVRCLNMTPIHTCKKVVNEDGTIDNGCKY